MKLQNERSATSSCDTQFTDALCTPRLPCGGNVQHRQPVATCLFSLCRDRTLLHTARAPTPHARTVAPFPDARSPSRLRARVMCSDAVTSVRPEVRRGAPAPPTSGTLVTLARARVTTQTTLWYKTGKVDRDLNRKKSFSVNFACPNEEK